MFDYYEETDTLIMRMQRWPDEAKTYSSGPFTVVVDDSGELIELEIRRASHFLSRALAEGVMLPEDET